MLSEIANRSVIFHGIVEKQKSGNITSIFHAANSVQIEVYVGINTEGVYVIDAGEKVGCLKKIN